MRAKTAKLINKFSRFKNIKPRKVKLNYKQAVRDGERSYALGIIKKIVNDYTEAKGKP